MALNSGELIFCLPDIPVRERTLVNAHDKSLIRLQNKTLTSQELMVSGGGPAVLPCSCEETRPAE